MPQFSPGESKVALATFTVKPAGLSCTAELWLGNLTKVATSGLIPFTSTGASQSISLPITMPGAEGTYPVFLDVFVAGQLVGAYRAIEDVVIALPKPVTEILRPNANGDLQQLISQYPDTGYHWDKVDDVTPDESSTFVATSHYDYAEEHTDLYQLPDVSLTGIIQKVVVCTRCKRDYYGDVYVDIGKTAIKTHGSIYYGEPFGRAGSAWQTFSTEYTVNPYTGQPWTWPEINDLQAGVMLWALFGGVWGFNHCTQVYVEVNYIPLD